MNTERLPIGLVAWDGQAPVGFIALRERPGHAGRMGRYGPHPP